MSEMELAMAEALSAVEGKIEMRESKIPEGKTLVAVKLDRNPERSGRYIEAIPRDWQCFGTAIAIRNGSVLAGNPLFGRWTKGEPKVTAMHWVLCPRCGNRVAMPLAVWEAKDNARKRGIQIPDETPGMAVLEKYGSCSCGVNWVVDREGEKAQIVKFKDEVLDALSTQDTVSPWVGPTAFTVTAPAPAIPGWEWLSAAVGATGKGVSLFKKDDRGDVLLYNPGFWLGWVDDYNSTNLFWVEQGKKRGKASMAFNPRGVEGL